MPNENNKEYAEYLNEQLMLYKKENEKLVNEFRDFRHNVLNIMHGINGFMELEDWDGLKNYFHKVLENIKPIDTNLSTIKRMKDSALKELLKIKYKKADQIGIAFKLMTDQKILIQKDLLDKTDLCQVISELLDQAIEAASDSNNKKVAIYLLGNGNTADIFIESTFKETPSIFQIDAVSNPLDKYPDILCNAFVEHQTFVHHLQIKKRSNRCD